MPAAYRFLDQWVVPHDIEAVFDLVGDPLAYPEWWHDVFLEASGDAGPPKVGNRVSVVARGFLPYRLRFALATTAVDRPTRLASRLEGDFEGTGEWRLHSEGASTICELDWRPLVNKAGVKQLTPVLRPLFRANHNWTMRRGQQRILERLGGSAS
ncbi:MAG TPA: SRPBCC family protein [Gaiellaceae bacterium]|nr:SRPBCC family protein [Gaiellaceae bacterium]